MGHSNSSKTIRSSTPPNGHNDLHIHLRHRAKHSNDISTIAEAHLHQALRLIPFELSGNALQKKWFSNDHMTSHGDPYRRKRKRLDSDKRIRLKRQGGSRAHAYIREISNTWTKLSMWFQGENVTWGEDMEPKTDDISLHTSLQHAKEALFHLEQAAQCAN